MPVRSVRADRGDRPASPAATDRRKRRQQYGDHRRPPIRRRRRRRATAEKRYYRKRLFPVGRIAGTQGGRRRPSASVGGRLEQILESQNRLLTNTRLNYIPTGPWTGPRWYAPFVFRALLARCEPSRVRYIVNINCKC